MSLDGIPAGLWALLGTVGGALAILLGNVLKLRPDQHRADIEGLKTLVAALQTELARRDEQDVDRDAEIGTLRADLREARRQWQARESADQREIARLTQDNRRLRDDVTRLRSRVAHLEGANRGDANRT